MNWQDGRQFQIVDFIIRSKTDGSRWIHLKHCLHRCCFFGDHQYEVSQICEERLFSVSWSLLLVVIVLKFGFGASLLIDEDDRAEDGDLGADTCATEYCVKLAGSWDDERGWSHFNRLSVPQLRKSTSLYNCRLANSLTVIQSNICYYVSNMNIILS